MKLLNGLSYNIISPGQSLHVSVTEGQITYPQNNPSQTQEVLDPVSNPPYSSDTYTQDGLLSVKRIYEENVDNGKVTLEINGSLLHNVKVDFRKKKWNENEGLYYGGKSPVNLRENQFQQLEISPEQYSSLQFVKSIEGNYDAINTWDSGIFSYGFIQFTGESGNLDKLLLNMQKNAPYNFHRSFGNTIFIPDNGVIQFQDKKGQSHQGKDAWQNIKEDDNMLGAFIQAGFDEILVLEQYRLAISNFVKPALNNPISFTLADGSIISYSIKSLFPKGKIPTLAIAMWINLGPNGARLVLSDMLTSLAKIRGISNQIDFANIDWPEVCKHLISRAKSPDINVYRNSQKADLTVQRAQELLNFAGLT